MGQRDKLLQYTNSIIIFKIKLKIDMTDINNNKNGKTVNIITVLTSILCLSFRAS